jgi:hypothetical protein
MSQSKVDSLEKKLTAARKELSDAKGRKFVTCGSCKKKSQIGKVEYLQTHWYVEPVS